MKRKAGFTLMITVLVIVVFASVAVALVSQRSQTNVSYDVDTGEMMGSVNVEDVSLETLKQLCADRGISLMLPNSLPADFEGNQEPSFIDITSVHTAEDTVLGFDKPVVDDTEMVKVEHYELTDASKEKLRQEFSGAGVHFIAANGKSFSLLLNVLQGDHARAEISALPYILDSDLYVYAFAHDYNTQQGVNHWVQVYLFGKAEKDQSTVIKYELASTDYTVEEMMEIAHSLSY